MLLKMVLYLGVVLALIYFGLRWVGPRVSRWKGTGPHGLRVVDQVAIGNRKSVLLLKAAGRYFLLGASDSSIRTIAELDAREVAGHYPEQRDGSEEGRDAKSGRGTVS
jgi:flagellar biosynthetic protein FliO